MGISLGVRNREAGGLPTAPGIHSTVLHATPLVRVEDVCCRPGRTGPEVEEWVARPGFAMVRAGVFRKRLGRREVLADWNHAVFFNAGESYRISHPREDGDHCSYYSFSVDTIGEAMEAFRPRAGRRDSREFPFTHALVPPRGLLADLGICRRWGAGGPDPLAVEAMALDLLEAVLASGCRTNGNGSRPIRPASRRDHRAWCDAARMYLASRFAGRIHLLEVARAVGCSPFHLARIFRREVGMPIHRYLTHLRLKAALLKVSDGDPDLTRVGLEAGFSSHSHFTTAFRRATGLTPSDFRRGPSLKTFREISKNLKA